MKRPILIDRLIKEQIDKNIHHEAVEINEKLYIAKPVSFFDFETIFEHIYHAYLVLIGKASAFQYKEDRRRIENER